MALGRRHQPSFPLSFDDIHYRQEHALSFEGAGRFWKPMEPRDSRFPNMFKKPRDRAPSAPTRNDAIGQWLNNQSVAEFTSPFAASTTTVAEDVMSRPSTRVNTHRGSTSRGSDSVSIHSVSSSNSLKAAASSTPFRSLAQQISEDERKKKTQEHLQRIWEAEETRVAQYQAVEEERQARTTEPSNEPPSLPSRVMRKPLQLSYEPSHDRWKLEDVLFGPRMGSPTSPTSPTRSPLDEIKEELPAYSDIRPPRSELDDIKQTIAEIVSSRPPEKAPLDTTSNTPELASKRESTSFSPPSKQDIPIVPTSGAVPTIPRKPSPIELISAPSKQELPATELSPPPPSLPPRPNTAAPNSSVPPPLPPRPSSTEPSPRTELSSVTVPPTQALPGPKADEDPPPSALPDTLFSELNALRFSASIRKPTYPATATKRLPEARHNSKPSRPPSYSAPSTSRIPYPSPTSTGPSTPSPSHPPYTHQSPFQQQQQPQMLLSSSALPLAPSSPNNLVPVYKEILTPPIPSHAIELSTSPSVTYRARPPPVHERYRRNRHHSDLAVYNTLPGDAYPLMAPEERHEVSGGTFALARLDAPVQMQVAEPPKIQGVQVPVQRSESVAVEKERESGKGKEKGRGRVESGGIREAMKMGMGVGLGVGAGMGPMGAWKVGEAVEGKDMDKESDVEGETFSLSIEPDIDPRTGLKYTGFAPVRL